MKQNIEELAAQIYNMATFNATKPDIGASGIPEFIAYEVIDLTEWRSNSPEQAKEIAATIIKVNSINLEAATIIKNYFNLTYN